MTPVVLLTKMRVKQTNKTHQGQGCCKRLIDLLFDQDGDREAGRRNSLQIMQEINGCNFDSPCLPISESFWGQKITLDATSATPKIRCRGIIETC